jgi:hypothetical protein
MKVILGNPTIIAAYKSGIPANGKPFPDGSKIATVQWKPKKRPEACFPWMCRMSGRSRADSSGYDIAVSPAGKEQIDEHHRWYWFNVTVKRGNETIIASDNAVGLCSSNEAGPNAREHQRQEIEARVRAYLDWRKRL